MNPRWLPLPTLLVSTLALCAAGCSASSGPITAPLETPRAAEKSPTPSPRILVWTTNEDGERMTWTLDESGSPAGLVDGIHVVARGGVWAWRETTEKLATTACPAYDDNGVEQPAQDAPAPGTGVRVALVREGSADRTELVAPEGEEGAQDLEENADLVASVGPYLFIRESTYAYTCGAHGNVGVSFRIYDAERGADVWTSGRAGRFVDAGAVARQRGRAQADLAVDQDVAMFVTDGKLDLDLTAVLPSYGTDASLELGLQFTAASCYACSDGAWSSYTKSTVEPLDDVPAPLRPWVAAPSGVARFAGEHPTLTVGGWSRLPGA
jgi:hypothetical protein